jgi:hypothetical protein
MTRLEFRTLAKGMHIRLGARGKVRAVQYVVTARDGSAEQIYVSKANGDYLTITVDGGRGSVTCAGWVTA